MPSTPSWAACSVKVILSYPPLLSPSSRSSSATSSVPGSNSSIARRGTQRLPRPLRLGRRQLRRIVLPQRHPRLAGLLLQPEKLVQIAQRDRERAEGVLRLIRNP